MAAPSKNKKAAKPPKAVKPAKDVKPAKVAAKKSLPASLKLSIFIILVAAVIFAPMTLVFVVCMMPTLVAMVVDKQPQKTLWLTVGSTNLAGTVPAWFRLWETGGRISDSVAVLSDPAVLLVAFGAAAAGWLIHMNVTPLVAALVVRRNEGRLKDIEKKQRDLVRKWGEDIGKTAT